MAKVLVGFMGAGKSTLAQLLASDFIDMDSYLEEELGQTISDFFASDGEEAFRSLETKLLKQLLTLDVWIATGGGIVEREVNRRLLAKADEVVYLRADFETLYQRLKNDDKQKRPLFHTKNKEELKNLFERREPLYKEVATMTLDVDENSVEALVSCLLKSI